MSSEQHYTFSSESVSEGHPDKVCDLIADAVLDACLEQDPHSHVACEVMCKHNTVVLGGEITHAARLNYEEIVRRTIREIGYTDPAEPFNADAVQVLLLLSRQSNEINQGVVQATDDHKEQGAGDQGIMFGYATDESGELMPLPILLAHRLTRGLAEDRRSGKHDWLRPDSSRRSRVVYRGNTPIEVATVLISTQHRDNVSRSDVQAYVERELAPRVLGEWYNPRAEFIVNPSGSFILGGPSADCGVTGRKIIVDSYGGAGRHGGGAFSGKDPSKVDRSGAYYLPLRRAAARAGRLRAEGGAAGRLRDRPRQAALDQGRHLRHRRRAEGGEVRGGQLRLPARQHHPGTGAVAAHLPADHELRPLRQDRIAVGEGGRSRHCLTVTFTVYRHR